MAKTSKKQAKPVGTGARLTDEQVAKIKELRKADPEKWTFMALAERFKCTDGTAYRAVTGGARKPKAAKKAKAIKKPKPLVLAPKPAKAKKAKAPKPDAAQVVDEGDAAPVAAAE